MRIFQIHLIFLRYCAIIVCVGDCNKQSGQNLNQRIKERKLNVIGTAAVLLSKYGGALASSEKHKLNIIGIVAVLAKASTGSAPALGRERKLNIIGM